MTSLPLMSLAGVCQTALAIVALLVAPPMVDGAEPPSEVTRRAIAFLAREVPAWPQQNKCFSCHNNGDGMRALLIARQRGWDVPDDSLAETREWLLHPERWETSGGNPDYSDRRLVNVEFGAALATLTADSPEREESVAALRSAAGTIAELQFPDGSWAFEVDGTIGSPVGYGRPLMTVVARDILISADRPKYREQIDRAQAWLRQIEPRTILDSAAVLMGLANDEHPRAVRSVEQRLSTIRDARSDRGGWGPYRISSPEPFDTAVVLLALSRLAPTRELQDMLNSGRNYLAATQLPSGGWPATTRPAGLESYPEMISTSAWATLALVMTKPAVD
jgi:hypothetical protein